MKTLVLFLVVLATFGTQSHGFEVYNIISPNNNGGNIQETVTIDNEKNAATINIHAGLCSSTTVFDYKHGYIASRMFSRRACYILKMDREAIPALDELKQYIYERQITPVLKAVRRLGSWASLGFPSARTFLFKQQPTGCIFQRNTSFGFSSAAKLNSFPTPQLIVRFSSKI
ncbi:gastrokine-2 isoform X2 [Desmodus rotundus]|uniref:gastrokine-2 isoform X2 n=1 Tax=Desmodus rotundus TaxID=9430 RepID=UPI00238136A1|nr:gastrokine-2 isoform X2 [Desmodus rotundus]